MADEYIRKRDAVSAANHALDRETLLFSFVRKVAISALKELHAEDVVPVVRCKDCKFYTSMRPDIKTGICGLNVHHMGDEGFCSCGERREE